MNKEHPMYLFGLRVRKLVDRSSRMTKEAFDHKFNQMQLSAGIKLSEHFVKNIYDEFYRIKESSKSAA